MKTCGDCTMCCDLIEIDDDDLKKPAHQLCRFVCKGCAIYRDRPKSCAEFECLWLQTEELPSNFRPDRCGIIMQSLPDGRGITMFCKPADYVSFWRKQPFMNFIHGMLRNGLRIAVTDSARIKTFFPRGEQWELREMIQGEDFTDEEGVRQKRVRAGTVIATGRFG